MKLIGITGGVGAGKTEILSFIKQHYCCKIYLADQVAKDIQMPGQACYDRMVSLLGKDVLCEDGTINKAKMAEKIFAEPELLLQVNAIVHPAVRDYLLSAIEQAKQDKETELFFIEAALLIECGYGQIVDEMWYVYASDEVRRARLRIFRGYSDEKITQIMESQLTDEAFRENSDFIIDNSGTLAESYSQIREKLEAYTWQD